MTMPSPDKKISRADMLSMLEREEKKSRFRYWDKYIGPGILNLLKRAFFLRGQYLAYLFNKETKFYFVKTKTKTFWGRPIEGTKNSSISYGFIFEPPELKLTKFLVKHLKDEDIFYDIGANIGFYSLLAEELIGGGEVHCFEPVHSLFQLLSVNLDGSSNIFRNECALSDREGDITMYKVGNESGLGTMIKDVATTYEGQHIDSVTTKATTLSAYTKEHRKPTVIKLDVEGAENKVIGGGAEFLKNGHPLIIMEAWGGIKGHKFSRGAIDQLREFGYRPRRITYDGELMPTTEDIDIDSIKDFENIVFEK